MYRLIAASLLMFVFGIKSAFALELISPTGYQVGKIGVGERVYLDRDFNWQDVGKYAGGVSVLGRNNDKQTAVITVRHTGRLYAAVQQGVAEMPAGSGWARTGDEIVANVRHAVWFKDVSGQEVIQPVCPHGACNAVIVFSGEPTEARKPFEGTLVASWTHDYKTEPAAGVVKDIDVDHYLVYQGARILKQVQDDNSGSASTEFVFPGAIPAYQGQRFCIQISAVAFEPDSKHTRRLESGKSDEACIVLPVVDQPVPIVPPSKPGGISIKADIDSGALRLTIEP